MEPKQCRWSDAVARRVHMLSSHFAVEASTPSSRDVTPQVCAELAAIRACRRTKDVVYYMRPNEEGEVRRCKTTHQVLSGQFILHGRTEASSESKGPPRPKDDDILPPCLVYMDSWLPTDSSQSETGVGAEEPIEKRCAAAQRPTVTESTDSRRSGTAGGKGICGRRNCESKSEERSTQVSNGILANLGAEWEPKMDVLESPTDFVVSLELPGVPVDGIRVELHDETLVITGARAPQVWSNAGGHITFGPPNGHAVYHKRELAQGPYKASWAVPENCDYDKVSAEFADGVLSVVLPKKTSKKA